MKRFTQNSAAAVLILSASIAQAGQFVDAKDIDVARDIDASTQLVSFLQDSVVDVLDFKGNVVDAFDIQFGLNTGASPLNSIEAVED